MEYSRSPFRDIESYLRIVVRLDEDDFKVILKQYKSTFGTYEILPGIHSIKDLSEAINYLSDHKGTLRFEYDDISKKTKLISSIFVMLIFNEKSFLISY